MHRMVALVCTLLKYARDTRYFIIMFYCCFTPAKIHLKRPFHSDRCTNRCTYSVQSILLKRQSVNFVKEIFLIRRFDVE